jgi:hypothetical protein
MSAKSKRDALLSQLTSSLATQAPAESPAGVGSLPEAEPPLESAVTGAEEREVAPASEEQTKGKNPVPAKPARKTVAKKIPASEAPSPSATGSPPAAGSGKQTALWLDDEDRGILHEMGMQLYSQGIKPSHNLVVRVALRMLPKDHRFFEKAKELIEQDGRKVRHR